MYKDAKISGYQLFTLLSGFMLGSSLIISPATPARNDAWLAFLLGLSWGAVLLCIYVSIARLNPSCGLVEILEKNLGKVFGKILSVLYIWYFIHLAALVLRNFGEFSVVTAYTETPILFIVVCFALIVVYSVRSGIEVMGRISEVFVFILVAVLIFVFLGLVTEYEPNNLKPFLTQDMKLILKYAFSVTTFPFGETVVFLMFFRHMNKQKHLFKASMYSLITVGIFLLSTIIRNLMVIGADMMLRDVFSSHIAFRLIPGIDLDPLLDINLTVAGIVKAGVCIFAASTALTEVLGLDDYKPFVLSVSAFTVTLSIWVYSSLMEMIQWAEEIWPYYSIPFQIIIPLLLLIISFIKRKLKHT